MNGDFYFQWHITDKCGNRCKHCYQDSYSGKDMPLSLVEEILEDMKEFCNKIECIPEISFVGGDPFKHNKFIEILMKAKEITDHINILGNPEIIIEDDGSLIKFLKDIKISTYQLSIDGLENTHDDIRYKGSYQKTIEAINILSRNDIRVTVLSTISKTNYKEMLDIMDIVYKQGASGWDFSRIVTDNTKLCLDKEEYKSLLFELVDKHEKYEKIGKPFLRKDPLLSIIYNGKKNDEKLSNMGRCGIGGPIMTILPTAEIMGCRRHSGSSLGIWSKENNFINIFLFNEKLNKMRELNKIDKCNKCKLIDACCGCRAIGFLHTEENIYGTDPQCFLS